MAEPPITTRVTSRGFGKIPVFMRSASLLRSVAVVWLTCHLGAVCVAAVAACCPPAHHADQQAECCPGVGPGQVCPMHHTTEGKPECVMRSTCGHSDAALVSLAGGVGLPPHFSTTPVTLQSLDTMSAIAPSALSRAEHPDSPPPRV
jgi:hypothetical protein